MSSSDMFQIMCDDDEIFVSSATVKDVEVITNSMSVTTK